MLPGDNSGGCFQPLAPVFMVRRSLIKGEEMNGERNRPVAGWYMPVAILCLLLTAAAALIFVTHHLMVDPATLPLDIRTAHEAVPAWMMLAAGIASGAGLLASLFLVLKRRFAEPLMLISVAAFVVFLAGMLLVPPLRDILSTNDFAVAIVFALVLWTIYTFARRSRRRGWLR